MHDTARYWIERLALGRHPEGGYFRETYRADEEMAAGHLPARFRGPRPFSTGIYFLLADGDCSALHRLRADEVWHFYAGGGLTLHVIDPAGERSDVHLGSKPERGDSFQAVMRAGCWFGATLIAPPSYALVGCTVAPGFRFDDFELGERAALLQVFPQHRALIERLTRA